MSKKYILLLCLFAVAMFLAVSGKFDQSVTNAAYKTTIEGSSTAQIAKWEISEIEQAGAGIEMNAGILNLDGGDKGTWYFEVTNKSDVTAMIDATSSIQLHLQSAVFGTENFVNKTGIEWNYLDGTNPIMFKVTAYKASVSELLSYKNGSNAPISLEEYLGLANKEGYEEIVSSSYERYDIFDTSSTVNNLSHHSEIVESAMVHSISQDFAIPNTIGNLDFNGTNDTITFRVEWDIKDQGGNSGEITETFKIYDEETGLEIDGEVEFYEYVKYLSSIKGEPHFEFPSDKGGTVDIRYSNLSETQRQAILNGNNTVWAKNTYLQYEKYLASYSGYLESLGYLEGNLNLTIKFNVKISQVD